MFQILDFTEDDEGRNYQKDGEGMVTVNYFDSSRLGGWVQNTNEWSIPSDSISHTIDAPSEKKGSSSRSVLVFKDFPK